MRRFQPSTGKTKRKRIPGRGESSKHKGGNDVCVFGLCGWIMRVGWRDVKKLTWLKEGQEADPEGS